MSIGYAFLNFWNANGGATIFGFPLTNEVLDPASQLSVQYFERARFEYHPEAAGSPQVVQLTNVGRIITAGRVDPRYDNNSAFAPQPLVPAGSDRSYYVQTQHSIGGEFKKFFDQNGGTFVFGYPISEETIEANPTDGVAYTVQWFERARFEFHPEFNNTRERDRTRPTRAGNCCSARSASTSRNARRSTSRNRSCPSAAETGYLNREGAKDTKEERGEENLHLSSPVFFASFAPSRFNRSRFPLWYATRHSDEWRSAGGDGRC